MVIPLRLLLLAVLSVPTLGAAGVTQNDAIELYHDYCSVCHGDRGDGRSRARQGLIPPPRDFTAPGAAKDLPRDRMIESVLNGRPGTAMVGWKSRLSPQQAAAIVDYIRTHFMQEGSSAGKASAGSPSTAGANPHAEGTNPHTAAVKSNSVATPQPTDATPVAKAALQGQLPRGSAARGQPLYMANCSTCHGVEGKGNGPRAYFIFPRPRDFTSSQAREKLADRATLFRAVQNGVQGKEMPAWGKVFNAQQIADVSAFVATQFMQTGTRHP